MNILAIETSCDETAIAIVRAEGDIVSPRFKILADVVSTQIEVHREFGGVVPNLAKREHTKNLPIVLNEALALWGEDKDHIDLICVTVGPGLEPALWTGINFAKNLEKKWSTPVLGVNHLEGHLYSFLLAQNTKSVEMKDIFPGIQLLASGGHTILVEMGSLAQYRKLGETRDDAAGEAFDKVARMLDLPYPGGAEIEKLAQQNSEKVIDFPRPMIHSKNYDFSFSGLKTAVLYYLKDNPEALKTSVAAGFQKAVVEVLSTKVGRAYREYNAQSIFLSGGVAANSTLREKLASLAKAENGEFFVSEMKHNTDNGAMIAVAGYLAHLQKKRLPLVANGNLNL